jgi:hypothetical protein
VVERATTIPAAATTSSARSGPGCALARCSTGAHQIDLAARRLEVVEVRHEAGRFGRGYKD